MSGVSGSAWKDMKGVQLQPATLSYLSECVRFPFMAPVQARTIPLLLGTYDVVVEAITGSGKTLAYLLPCLEMLQRDRVIEACAGRKNAVVAVVVLPSRELAQQVHAVARGMLSHLASHSEGKLRYASQCFIGGRDVSVDLDLLRRSGGNVLIGTPGRMCELLVSPKHSALLDFSAFELLVLDEADKLLDFGFKAKLDAILRRLPSQRRTGLFSATQTRELAELARAGMRNPVSVTVRSATLGAAAADAAKPQVPELLRNYFAFARASAKLDRLLELLHTYREQKVLVYVMTCASVDWLHAALVEVLLRDDAENIFALHGQMKLDRRQKVHRAVTRRDRCVLICTDVAARGLDIPAVSVVLQYDPPVDPSTFIHRIGRTARMGRQGDSVVLLMPQEFEYVAFMRMQNVAIEPLDESCDAVDDAREEARQMHAKRTLYSCAQEGARRKRPRNAKGSHEPQRQNRRGQEVLGDMCESPAVLQLRRAARDNARLLDLAARAFVSFVRAYKEHECRYIFQLQHIDLTDLTHGFALFKIPSCGEIRQMRFLRIPLQDELAEVLETVNARTREKREQRQREEESRADRSLAHSEKDEDDDNANENPARRHRTERNEKLEALKQTKMTQGERSRAWRQAEMDELMKDSYYVKKERRGKVTRGVVDKIMGVHALENAMMSVRDRREARKTRRATH